MAVIEGGVSGALQEVEADKKAARVVAVPYGNGYAYSAATGTLTAAIAANSSFLVMRLSPAASVNAFVDRIRIQFTTIVAFTTPVTAGRRLAMYRGSGAAASGGTASAALAVKDSTRPVSNFNSAVGGDARVSTTGALTVTGITYETEPFAIMTLSHVGAAGGFMEDVFEFSESLPLVLIPGQLIAIRNPAAMDAAGTWQMSASIQWREASSY